MSRTPACPLQPSGGCSRGNRPGPAGVERVHWWAQAPFASRILNCSCRLPRGTAIGQERQRVCRQPALCDEVQARRCRPVRRLDAVGDHLSPGRSDSDETIQRVNRKGDRSRVAPPVVSAGDWQAAGARQRSSRLKPASRSAAVHPRRMPSGSIRMTCKLPSLLRAAKPRSPSLPILQATTSPRS